MRAEQLESLQHMRSLRRLKLWNPTALSFPRAAWHSRLQELDVCLQPLSTVLSLVRAHAATLDTLTVHCDSEPGGSWAFPGLAAGLQQCALPELRRLVLGRRNPSCKHLGCSEQVQALRESLNQSLNQSNAQSLNQPPDSRGAALRRRIDIVCGDCDRRPGRGPDGWWL